MDGGLPEPVVVHQAHPVRSLNEHVVKAAVERAAKGEGFRISELSIVLADRATVHELNREWLGHDFATDVVSFPLAGDAVTKKRIEGEIYVDLDTAAERAPDFDTSFENEALRYIIHGLLHLAGHDDGTEEQRAAMRTREDLYLTTKTA